MHCPNGFATIMSFAEALYTMYGTTTGKNAVPIQQAIAWSGDETRGHQAATSAYMSD